MAKSILKTQSPETMQVATMSFFRYPWKNRRWAMAQMWAIRKPLSMQPGVRFFKPVGTGGGSGYSMLPDLSVYGLLAVWEDEVFARAFLSSPLFAGHASRSAEHFTITMLPRSSKGSWSKFSSWECSTTPPQTDAVCVLTRATIKGSYLPAFWRQVAPVSRAHEQAGGLLFTKGIGEIPLLEQATFSIWESLTSMEAFAYSGPHAKAIAQTRREMGFKEEMFTRFEPIDAIGTWNGSNPLAGRLKITREG